MIEVHEGPTIVRMRDDQMLPVRGYVTTGEGICAIEAPQIWCDARGGWRDLDETSLCFPEQWINALEAG